MNKVQGLSLTGSNYGCNSGAKAWWVPCPDQRGTDLSHVFISAQSRHAIEFYRILTGQKKLLSMLLYFVLMCVLGNLLPSKGAGAHMPQPLQHWIEHQKGWAETLFLLNWESLFLLSWDSLFLLSLQPSRKGNQYVAGTGGTAKFQANMGSPGLSCLFLCSFLFHPLALQIDYQCHNKNLGLSC